MKLSLRYQSDKRVCVLSRAEFQFLFAVQKAIQLNSRTTLGLSCSVIYAGERLDIERIEIEEDRSRERQAGADIRWQKVRYILCMCVDLQ